MTFTIPELKAALEKKFTIKGMVDLSDLTTDPGSAMAFFNSVYQRCYDPHDRIVIFTSQDISIELLHHLYDTTNFLDISNFFVMICGPNNLETSISEACFNYSNDPVPFQFYPVTLETTKNINYQFLLPATICAIPWTHLQIKNNGDITPCCVMTDATIGNIDSMTMEEAFTSDRLNDLRTQLLQGKKPKECSRCWEQEDQGRTSIRIHNLNRLKNNFLSHRLQDPKIVSLHLELGNTCNFKCRICSSFYSSLFAQEEKEFNGIVVKAREKWEDRDEFINQISGYMCQIQNIDMYGGEPFLIKKFQKVLQFAVDNGYANNIRLHYNSNGSIWPEDLIPLWKHFKEVDILFSIDDIGPRFELQRGGNWSQVENNILRLKNLEIENLRVNIMPTVSVMNVYYLDQLYDWAVSNNLHILINYVQSSRGYEISSLTERARQELMVKYQDHPWEELRNLSQSLKSLPFHSTDYFWKSTQWFDKVRQENFASTHPEISSLMGKS